MLERVSIATVICVLGFGTRAAEEPPREWIESATRHRVLRLSREPGTSSFYFHQNAYTADRHKMVVSTRDGLSTINLQTREIEPIVEGRAGNVIVGRKTRQVFYTRDGSVFSTQLDTRATRKIATVARELLRGSGFAVNADETLLAASYIEGGQGTNFPPPASAPAGLRSDNPPGKGAMMERRWAAGLPMALYTVNIQDGRNPNVSSHDQLAQSRSVFSDRPDPYHVLSRGTVAQSGPHLDDPHRRQRFAKNPHADDGHGDRRTRILRRRW